MVKGTHPVDEDEPQEPREFGFFWGIVVNNDDPQNRGRIKAQIPGITETSSPWAEAIGNPGQGGGKHGFMAIPKVGATVLMGFIQGDVDEPFYLGGPPPEGEQVDGHDKDNVVMQTDTFRISMNEAQGQKSVRIETLLPDATEAEKLVAQTFIEVTTQGGDNNRTHAVRIFSGSSVSVTASGGVEIDAPVVNIKGRSVRATSEPI